MKNGILLILFLNSLFIQAQFVMVKKELPDSALTIPMITSSYAYQWTAAEMADRFGANHNVGVSFAVKTKTNWYYGFKGNFLWGGFVRQNNILENIGYWYSAYDDNGDYSGEQFAVIDNEGRLTNIYFGQRGSSFFLIGGRMFNKFAPNKNSGILVYGGIGMLQHKISIKFQDDVSALTDEHKKGYDRFSLGYAVNGFVGYLFMSKNRLANFFGGFDYTLGWTKSLRKFNYDTQQYDNDAHTNILYGIRLGWIIRLNKRQSQEYYYN